MSVDWLVVLPAQGLQCQVLGHPGVLLRLEHVARGVPLLIAALGHPVPRVEEVLVLPGRPERRLVTSLPIALHTPRA